MDKDKATAYCFCLIQEWILQQLKQSFAPEVTQLNDLSSRRRKRIAKIQRLTYHFNWKNPRVLFEKQGTYSVKLAVKRNSNGENSLIRQGYIVVKSPVFCPKHGGRITRYKKAIMTITSTSTSAVLKNRTTVGHQPESSDRCAGVQVPAGFDFTIQISHDYGFRGHILNNLVNVQNGKQQFYYQHVWLVNGVLSAIQVWWFSVIPQDCCCA